MEAANLAAIRKPMSTGQRAELQSLDNALRRRARERAPLSARVRATMHSRDLRDLALAERIAQLKGYSSHAAIRARLQSLSAPLVRESFIRTQGVIASQTSALSTDIGLRFDIGNLVEYTGPAWDLVMIPS